MLPEPRKPLGRTRHTPLHPDARWEEGCQPPGAVSPSAKAGSGQGHGGGSGLCGPQRWHSPAPAQPGPLGLPGGSPLPRQAVAGGPGAAWAGNVSSEEGSGMRAQPLAARQGHARRREGSAGLLPNRGSALSPPRPPRPCPHRAPGPAIPGFALASSQTPECACWLRGSCSWNRGDKAPPVSESGRTGRARPAPRMNRAQSPGQRMNGLTDAQTPVNGPRASKDAVELGTGRGARRAGMWGANPSGPILVKSLVRGEQRPPQHSDSGHVGLGHSGVACRALMPGRALDTCCQRCPETWRCRGEVPLPVTGVRPRPSVNRVHAPQVLQGRQTVQTPQKGPGIPGPSHSRDPPAWSRG